MNYLSFVISTIILFSSTYTIAQGCEKTPNIDRFDCYPEKESTKEKCLARNCCWRLPIEPVNSTERQSTDRGLFGVPFCYYPSDFPTYRVISSEATDIGQRIQILKSQTTYMPNDILNLTVDIIYETQQRLRIRIYDPANKRYEVPLQVPSVEKKANVTDYDVKVNQNPFSILITRKSSGVTL